MTNKHEAALFKWMKSPLMPITPEAISAMFTEIAAEQPTLELPTEDTIGTAYAGLRGKARGMGVARVAHRDEHARRYGDHGESDRVPADPEAGTGGYQVLRSGESELTPDVTDEMLEAAVDDPEQLRLARELNLRKYLECSSLSGEGVNDVFEAATRAALITFEKGEHGGCCVIL